MTVHAALFQVRTRRRGAGAVYQEQLDRLNASALAAVAELGWTGTLHAAAEESEQRLRRASREADVVVILGGDDVEPSLYGQPDRRPRKTGYERRADRLQIAVIVDAVRSRRPLLGVCRGLQLLNVALGGTLHQHVGGHRGEQGDPFVPTTVREPSLLDADLRPPLLCTHHQAVDDLGAGLHAVLRAADGVIEAVAHESLPILGVQWHPEHPDVASRQFTALLRMVHSGAASRTPLPTA